MKAKPYPKYKPSDVEWLGEVPEHWEVKRLSFVSRIQTGNTPSKTDEDNFTDDGMLWVKPDDLAEFQAITRTKECLSESGRILSRTIPARSVLVCCIGTIGKFGFADEEVATNQQINAITFKRTEIAEKFGIYVVSASEAEHLRRANTNVMAILNTTNQSNISIPVPLLPEQIAIADFLDNRTAKLDGLLEKKRALIGKLKEKRSALISRTVTKGLPPEAAAQAGLTPNPNPKLKPSGIPWLGDIPEHWEVKKLSWLFSYGKGREAATLTKEYVGSNPGEYPVYSGQTANEGLMGEIDTYEFDFKYPVILVTTVGAKAMTTRLVIGKLSLSQNCALIIPRSKELVAYFYEAVLQRLFDYEKGSISLIMQPSLRFEDLDRFHVPLMQHLEQVAIADYLGNETTKIDRMIQKVETAIEKLTEYRTALITAAVTGKIKV